MKHASFDVVVVGGGHAGVEAAHAAARSGATVGLVTLRADAIGVMSCNPAIGGLGKGHLVREIDALDGIMGRLADEAGIQFRLLNRRKGPAVQGPRAQSDRQIYRAASQREIERHPYVSVVEGEVTELRLASERVEGVVLSTGETILANAVVLTTGTFLNGIIHIGGTQTAGGRMHERPALRLAEQLLEMGLPLGRLKTGTPPRLDGRTIDWDRLEMQPGDEEPTLFSFLNKVPTARQISCGITHTNDRTHEVIRENLEKSAMYGGHIDGIGPRYCPSIEDKIVRFADKNSHQVFLEPEGLSDHTVYPNGISTSLPVDVQEEYVSSIVGLEAAKITQPGYAIEYDYVDPRALGPDLALRSLPGLYLAGQINGTTGYEEAAAQGLVAGLNAARRVREAEPVTFSRKTSYIGVLIDDLISKGVSEPYRMFTSRAEFRLSLRIDNADQRLTEFGRDIGCVGEDRWRAYSIKRGKLDAGREALAERSFSSRDLAGAGAKLNKDGPRRTGLDALGLKDVDVQLLRGIDPDLPEMNPEIALQIQRDAMYAFYVERQERDIAIMERDEALIIPAGFDFSAMPGLSTEIKTKLLRERPGTVGQAGRIDGMTPAALMLIASAIRRAERLAG